MSYNIDSVRYIKGELYIDADKARKLYRQYESDLPECHFLEPFDDHIEGEYQLQGKSVIKDPWWNGGHSGHAYEKCLFEILKHTTGHAQLLFVWEGGNSQTALDVKDGVVRETEVQITCD